MSRTKKGRPSVGKEYWGKRPLARTRGAVPGVETKKLTHRLERREADLEIKNQILPRRRGKVKITR